jgi:hypothetical protein
LLLYFLLCIVIVPLCSCSSCISPSFPLLYTSPRHPCPVC